MAEFLPTDRFAITGDQLVDLVCLAMNDANPAKARRLMREIMKNKLTQEAA